MQEEAGGHPADDKLQQRARLNEKQDSRQRRRHPAGERALPLFPVEKGAGIAQHPPADEGYEQQQHQADEVEPRGKREVAVTDRRARPWTLEIKDHTG